MHAKAWCRWRRLSRGSMQPTAKHAVGRARSAESPPFRSTIRLDLKRKREEAEIKRCSHRSPERAGDAKSPAPASLLRSGVEFAGEPILPGYFFTVTSTSPDSSFTLAVPQVVGLPVALKRQPNRPSFFSPHCPAFTATTNHPEPEGFPAGLPWV